MSGHRMVEDLEMQCFLLQERVEKQQARIQELRGVVEAARKVLDEGNDTEEALAAWDQLASSVARLDGEGT